MQRIPTSRTATEERPNLWAVALLVISLMTAITAVGLLGWQITLPY
jgi:hypothetical protein